MNPSREIRLVAALSLVLGLVLLTGGSNAEAAAGLPPTSIHGTNFLIKTQADLNFCIEAEPGVTEGRSLTMQGCSNADTQRWALPWYTTGLNQIIDNQGMCLNVRGHKADDWPEPAHRGLSGRSGRVLHLHIVGPASVRQRLPRDLRCGGERAGQARRLRCHQADPAVGGHSPEHVSRRAATTADAEEEMSRQASTASHERNAIMSLFSIRIIIATVVGVVLVSACTGAPGSQPAGSPAGTMDSAAEETAPTDQGSTGGGGASLIEAARAVTDACTLMPMDLVSTIVPDATEPVSQQLPSRCTVSNGTSVVEITIAASDAVDPLVPNEPVTGLGVAAYLQEPMPDNAYLKVILDPAGGAIYVEVAGHDGQDHTDHAIAIAERVLAGLE